MDFQEKCHLFKKKRAYLPKSIGSNEPQIQGRNLNIKIRNSSNFVELILEQMIFRAFVAIVIGEATASDLHVLTHVDTPCIVAIAREKAIGADLNTLRPDVVVMVAAVPAVCVGAHVRLSRECFR
jgi:hypothetical protein